jgi:hypothetical protein
VGFGRGLGVLMRVSVGFGFGLVGFDLWVFLVSGWVGFGWMFGGMGYGGSDFGPNGFLSDCWTDLGVVGDPCGFLFGWKLGFLVCSREEFLFLFWDLFGLKSGEWW